MSKIINYIKNFLPLFLVAGFIIALDQWTKSLVLNNLSIGQSWSPWEWLAPYARVVHWYNTGMALGMFSNGSNILKILIILISLGIIIFYPRISSKDWLIRLALGFLLGGALGNLIDRFTQGYVVDFFSVGQLPVINLADSCVTIGVCILLLGVWVQEKRKKQGIE